MNSKFMIHIRKTAILQYLMIYLVAHMTGTFFYNTNSMMVKGLAIGISVIVLVLQRAKVNSEMLLVVGGITAGMILSRALNGNVGVGSITDYVAPILLLYSANKIDKKNFCSRFVKFSTLFAFMSVFFWLFAMVAFPVFRRIMSLISIKYQYSVGMEVYESFFYALMPDNWVNNPRNDGIFSEPAQFSILLNAALWILLFAKEKVFLSQRKIRISLCILLVALATCQSTTGYICFAFMLLVFMLRKKDYMSKTIYKVVVAGLVILFVDYLIRGQESLMYTGLINKLVDTSGALSLEADDSTGKYRIATIAITWMLVLKRPWGWGVDYVERYVDLYSAFGTGSAGGGFTTELARYGFIPIAFFVGWIFHRIYKNRIPILPAAAYLFFYFWTVFAQAAITYPALFIPLFIGTFEQAVPHERMLRKEGRSNKEQAA